MDRATMKRMEAEAFIIEGGKKAAAERARRDAETPAWVGQAAVIAFFLVFCGTLVAEGIYGALITGAMVAFVVRLALVYRWELLGWSVIGGVIIFFSLNF